MTSNTRTAEAIQVAPYLTHVVSHHGRQTLIPPENAGRARKASKPQAKKEKKSARRNGERSARSENSEEARFNLGTPRSARSVTSNTSARRRPARNTGETRSRGAECDGYGEGGWALRKTLDDADICRHKHSGLPTAYVSGGNFELYILSSSDSVNTTVTCARCLPLNHWATIQKFVSNSRAIPDYISSTVSATIVYHSGAADVSSVFPKSHNDMSTVTTTIGITTIGIDIDYGTVISSTVFQYTSQVQLPFTTNPEKSGIRFGIRFP